MAKQCKFCGHPGTYCYKPGGMDDQCEHYYSDRSALPTYTPDPAVSPPHYKAANGLEAIDVIEAFSLGYRLGNVVKYVLRASRKGEALRDLRKAAWYLQRQIEKMEQEAGGAK